MRHVRFAGGLHRSEERASSWEDVFTELRGNALRDLKGYDETLASYDRALTLQPDYAEVLNNRGNALCELKRYDEALASYGSALTLRPDHVDALNNCGNTLRELKRFDEALASYDRARSHCVQ